MEIVEKLRRAGWDSTILDEPRSVHNDDGLKFISYPAEAFDLIRSENVGFWATHRFREFERLLKKYNRSTLVEVGAGSGAMAIPLHNAGFEVFAIEPVLAGTNHMVANGVTAIAAFLEDLKFPNSSISTLGIFDCSRAHRKPVQTVAEMHRIVEPGGLVFVSVPCGQWLWGSIDETLGHFRRYSCKSLIALMEQNGFRRVQTGYLFMSLVPVAFALRAVPYRLFQKSGHRVSVSNVKSQVAVGGAKALLINIVLDAELLCSRFFRMPYGLSVTGVFEKAVTAKSD